MCFFRADVLCDRMRGGQPGWRGNFTNVIVLLRTQKGAQLHCELVFAAVMGGERLNADFKWNPFNFNDADDLRGIQQ